MTQEDIIRMAEEAGWNDGGDYINIEQFAALVAAQRPWVGLTDEQIDEIFCKIVDDFEAGKVEYESHGFARAIEAKLKAVNGFLKEKNT